MPYNDVLGKENDKDTDLWGCNMVPTGLPCTKRLEGLPCQSTFDLMICQTLLQGSHNTVLHCRCASFGKESKTRNPKAPNKSIVE